jgi:hypothetical protein
MQPIWPFPGRVDWSQFRRDDEGVDLQYPGTTPIAILAIVDGTLATAGPDPNGFGMSYPLLNLDAPELGFNAIYYGHTFPDLTKVGKRVKQGDVIGQTGGLHSGGNAYGLSNWLEIGFWVPTSGNGVNMHLYLDGAKGGPPDAPLPTGGVGVPGLPTRQDAAAVNAQAKLIAKQAERVTWLRTRVRPAFTNGWRPQ